MRRRMTMLDRLIEMLTTALVAGSALALVLWLAANGHAGSVEAASHATALAGAVGLCGFGGKIAWRWLTWPR